MFSFDFYFFVTMFYFLHFSTSCKWKLKKCQDFLIGNFLFFWECSGSQIQSWDIYVLYKVSCIVTSEFAISLILSHGAVPRLLLTSRYMSPMSGHDRNSFSTSTFPMKPVKPVTKTFCPEKNSGMLGVDILKLIIFIVSVKLFISLPHNIPIHIIQRL